MERSHSTPDSGTADGTGTKATRPRQRLLLGSLLTLNDRLRELTEPDQADRPDEADDTPAMLEAASGSRVDRREADVRHLVIGVVAATEDRVREVTTATTRVAGRVVDTAAPLVGWLWRAPVVTPLRHRTERSVEHLVTRGRIEEDRSRQQASVAFQRTIGGVSGSPVIDDVVNDVVARALDPILALALPKVLGDLGDQPELIVPLVESIVAQVLDPILAEAMPKVLGDLGADPSLIVPVVNSIVAEALGPILDLALPQVLDDVASQPELIMPLVEAIVDEALEPLLREALPRVFAVLNEDPDAIRSLVRDQSTGIAVEMTETVRLRAAGADDRVDRIVRRVLRRPPLDTLDAGRPGPAALPAAVGVIVADGPVTERPTRVSDESSPTGAPGAGSR